MTALAAFPLPHRDALLFRAVTRRTSPTCAQRGRLCARASTSKGEVGRPQPAGRGRTGAGVSPGDRQRKTGE
jgi:hypothetical protein